MSMTRSSSESETRRDQAQPSQSSGEPSGEPEVPSGGLKDALLAFAGDESTITVHKPFVKFVGSLEGGMMLSQLLYWTPRSQMDGWVAKSDDAFADELCLSNYRVRKAREEMEEMGILDTEVRQFDGAPTVHYKVDQSALVEQFESFLGYRKNVLGISQEGSSDIPNSRAGALCAGASETTTKNTNKPTTTTSAPAGEDFGEDESEDSSTSGPGLTDGLKGHFDWLGEVGDEDKKQAVYRVADRLLTKYAPSDLRDASVREVCLRVIEAGYGKGILDEMSDLQREAVLDTLTDLYEEGRWSQAGHEWTEPVAAVAVARFRDMDLSRVGGIIEGWKKGARRQDSAGGSESHSPINGSGEVGGDSSRQGIPGPPGDASRPPVTWETGEDGLPADLEATKQWADAHDFSELLARGLWVACGQYGWTDYSTRSSARISDGDAIRNLQSYAQAHDTTLMGIANQHERGWGPE